MRPAEPIHPLGSESAEMRRKAADTLHHIARQIELGKIQVVDIDTNLPLVRVPGAHHTIDELEPGGTGTITVTYTAKG